MNSRSCVETLFSIALRIWTLYNENKDDLCARSVIGRSKPCGGMTVVRSKAIEKSVSTHERLFIG